jgi:hypothetical protein
VGALDLRAFPNDRVVAELLLLGLGQGASELKLGDLRFLLEVDEQPQRAKAARGARLDGHHDGFEGLAGGDVLHCCRVLGEIRQALRLRQLQVRNDQPLHRVRGFGVLEADLFDRGYLPGRCRRAHAVGVGQRLERGLGFGILGGHHDRTDGELLGPGKRALDGVGQEISRRGAFHHGRRHAIDSLCHAPGSLHRRGLHAGEACVDALDGRIGPVRVDLDDEFELVVSHGSLVLPYRNFANTLWVSAKDQRRLVPRERWLLPVSRLVW